MNEPEGAAGMFLETTGASTSYHESVAGAGESGVTMGDRRILIATSLRQEPLLVQDSSD